jgi:hypothetical protein
MALFLNCPKKYAPRIEKIEVVYLSSLYRDIYREKPLLSSIQHSPGIKIGHLRTDPPFIATILARLGLFQLLDDFPIDFVIADTLFYGMNYFMIPRSMGYAIKNYEGIRFALFSKNKDKLTIDDQVKISIVKQRSDILWLIDDKFLKGPPLKINFFIKNRKLADTSVTSIIVKQDTLLQKKLHIFRDSLDKFFNTEIHLEEKSFDDYFLSKIALQENVNVILYPENLFYKKIRQDRIKLKEIIMTVLCNLKMKKISMIKTEVLKFQKENKYRIWGEIKKQNMALLPSREGKFISDLFYKDNYHAY